MSIKSDYIGGDFIQFFCKFGSKTLFLLCLALSVLQTRCDDR